LQCPVGKSDGWLAQPQRYDFRFLFAVKDFGPRRRFTFFPVQHSVEPFGNESSSDIFDGSCSTRQRLGNLGVGPVRSVDIRLEQDICTPHFLRCSFQLFYDVPQQIPFFLAKPNNVLFDHEQYSIIIETMEYYRTYLPESLIVIKH